MHPVDVSLDSGGQVGDTARQGSLKGEEHLEVGSSRVAVPVSTGEPSVACIGLLDELISDKVGLASKIRVEEGRVDLVDDAVADRAHEEGHVSGNLAENELHDKHGHQRTFGKVAPEDIIIDFFGAGRDESTLTVVTNR